MKRGLPPGEIKTSFPIPPSVKKVVIGDGITGIGSCAFNGCSELSEITIPEGVTSIGREAFGDCISLTSLTLPENVSRIMYEAFHGCSSLVNMTFPEKVTDIGINTFDGCDQLTDVYYSGTRAQWNEIKIEETGNDLLKSAAIHCSDDPLTGTCGDNLRWTLDSSGFLEITGTGDMYDYAAMTSPWKEKDIQTVSIADGVTSIGNSAFKDCGGLTSIVIPDSVTNIGENAFRYCDDLADVYYSGTKAQWNGISTSETDSDPLKSATIHCSDGDIKPETPVDPTPPEPVDPTPPEPDDPTPPEPVEPDNPSVPDDAVLDISRSLTVPAGKRLNLLLGVPLKVSDGMVLRIDGTLSVSDVWMNEGTVEIAGEVTADGGIQNAGGRLSMTGGTLTSSSSGGTVRGDGYLTLTGGSITNTGSGPAVHLSAVPSEAAWDAVTIRSRTEHPVLLNGEPYVPDGYRVEQQPDGYYTLVRA